MTDEEIIAVLKEIILDPNAPGRKGDRDPYAALVATRRRGRGGAEPVRSALSRRRASCTAADGQETPRAPLTRSWSSSVPERSRTPVFRCGQAQA